MKIFISILFLTLCLFSCQKTSEQKINSSKDEKTGETKNITDRDKAGLKGEVKELTETFWYPKPDEDGVVPGKKIGEKKYTYDESGNLSGLDSIKSKRVEILYMPGWNHKYSDNGNIIESAKLNDDGTVAEKRSYKYVWKDHQGNWKEKYEYKNDAVLMITMREIIYFN